MTPERAREVLLQAIDLRRRWGEHVSESDFNRGELMEALVVLQEVGEETAHAETTKLKQQLGAASSREKKQQQVNDQLRADSAKFQGRVAELNAYVRQLEQEIEKLKTVLAGKAVPLPT